jgi:hypothetical protein
VTVQSGDGAILNLRPAAGLPEPCDPDRRVQPAATMARAILRAVDGLEHPTMRSQRALLRMPTIGSLVPIPIAILQLVRRKVIAHPSVRE